MYSDGFVMGDPKPDNFMNTQYGLMPIDFGAVFDLDDPLFQANKLAQSMVINAPLIYLNVFNGSELVDKYFSLDSEKGEESRLIF
jgi:hypothetical protein